jgi:hypothetical protein
VQYLTAHETGRESVFNADIRFINDTSRECLGHDWGNGTAVLIGDVSEVLATNRRTGIGNSSPVRSHRHHLRWPQLPPASPRRLTNGKTGSHRDSPITRSKCSSSHQRGAQHPTTILIRVLTA